MTGVRKIEIAFGLAVEQYRSLGVDAYGALDQLRGIAISVQCWLGDDIRGLEAGASKLGDGLAITGNYLGRARTADELRDDLEMVY